MISKTLSTSQKRAALHQVVPTLAEFCQAIYPLLVAHSDDFGRLAGDEFTVKHAIDPTSPRTLSEFETGLQALNDVGLITWYVVGGRKFIQIQNFDPHQIGLHKRTASNFPNPPSGSSGNFPEPMAEAYAGESLPIEGKGTEGNRTEGKKSGSAATPSVASLVLLTFPTIGKGPKTWDLTEAQRAEWQSLYPGLDVLGECRAALGWIRVNQPKTSTGMPKFLVNWFNRAVQRGGNSRPLGRAVPHERRAAEVPYHQADCPHSPKCGSMRECNDVRKRVAS
jgi:hypothetical protein